MKGRPGIYQNDELIVKAQEVFWQKGYNATSLSDLTKATGAGAGSLYNTFKGGKKELFKKALLQRRQDLNAFKNLAENSGQPLSLIKQFFMNIADADNKAHQKGCIVANTVVEMTFIDAELEQEAIQILKDTEEFYVSVIKEAQLSGEIQSKIPPDILGKSLITFWCGINSLRRIYPDKAILKQQIELQLQLLD